VIAGCVGISGSTTIGARCILGGMVGIAGHLQICDDVVLTGRTSVLNSIDKPGMYGGALHEQPFGSFRRSAARFRHLDELARRLRALERQVGLTDRQDGDGDL